MDEVLHIAYAVLTIVFLAVVVPLAASRRFVEKPIFALLLVVPLWNIIQKPARYSIRRLWPERAVPEAAS